MESSQIAVSGQTTIYRFRSSGEDAVGYVSGDEIFRLRWGNGRRHRTLRTRKRRLAHLSLNAFDEKELGRITTAGVIHSHGLFEGGNMGWLEPDGTVIRSGLIFAEEEVGRVDGPQRKWPRRLCC